MGFCPPLIGGSIGRLPMRPCSCLFDGSALVRYGTVRYGAAGVSGGPVCGRQRWALRVWARPAGAAGGLSNQARLGQAAWQGCMARLHG